MGGSAPTGIQQRANSRQASWLSSDVGCTQALRGGKSGTSTGSGDTDAVSREAQPAVNRSNAVPMKTHDRRHRGLSIVNLAMFRAPEHPCDIQISRRAKNIANHFLHPHHLMQRRTKPSDVRSKVGQVFPGPARFQSVGVIQRKNDRCTFVVAREEKESPIRFC